MTSLGSRRLWLSLALLIVIGGVLAESAAAADTDKRVGWHGETMPEGLERDKAEGDYVWHADGSIMVYVPPGEFTMGSDLEPDEQPVRQVHLDGYYIDKYEVSWGQWKASALPYSKTLNARRGLPEPPDWGIIDDHPVINTTWREAKAYAEWAGKRLPTEAEWEKAARGTDARTFPWGSDPPDVDRAIWRDHPIAKQSTAPVTCCAEGASPYGVHNLAGNVYEWCEDTYDSKFYARAPQRNPVHRDDNSTYRVLRGGAFPLEAEDMRSAYRYRLHDVDRGPYIGFRTALSGMGE